MDNMITLLTYFCMLSVAAERAVELLKRMILEKKQVPPVSYQLLAGIFGGIMSYYSPPPTTIIQLDPWVSILATGLAVSGGSAFWNTILDAVTAITKSLKATGSVPKG